MSTITPCILRKSINYFRGSIGYEARGGFVRIFFERSALSLCNSLIGFLLRKLPAIIFNAIVNLYMTEAFFGYLKFVRIEISRFFYIHKYYLFLNYRLSVQIDVYFHSIMVNSVECRFSLLFGYEVNEHYRKISDVANVLMLCAYQKRSVALPQKVFY